MHCRTGAQLSARRSPSVVAMPSSALMHSMFFWRISFSDPSVVNLARLLTNVSRATYISLHAAMRTAYTKPRRQRRMLLGSSVISRICDSDPIIGPHATSNMGAVASAGEREEGSRAGPSLTSTDDSFCSFCFFFTASFMSCGVLC